MGLNTKEFRMILRPSIRVWNLRTALSDAVPFRHRQSLALTCMMLTPFLGMVGTAIDNRPALAAETASAAAESTPFDAEILAVRPRIFIRRDSFDGLTVDTLRVAAEQPEFDGIRQKWRGRPLGRAILWMLDGEREDLEAAIAGLKKMDATGGSWSGRGLALIRLATLFDWLYPELDDVTRQATITKIERAADDAVAHIRGGRAPYFYSRTPGALAGVTLAGIALTGVSDTADGYLELFREWGVRDYFRAYEWVDGAATGATYTMYYTYVDLPSIAAAWWSATGYNPHPWIRENQGDWLDGIVRFYLWSLRPGFAFPDINDQYRGTWQTHDQFCQGLDIASYVTRNGYGRAWSQRWLGRCGPGLYHTEYAHNAVFRDSTLKPKPLTELPLAELFGRESCGYGFFRSDWPEPGEPDTATHVFFRGGDPMNVHGGVSAGEFQVFKLTPLATRSGRYGSYDSAPDQYHRNCISTNVVLMTDPAIPEDRGDQRTRHGMKSDHATWAQWQAIRERNGMDVATITDWRVTPDESRCRADLTKTNPSNKCKQWTRELVWLGNKHLVVLDIVETAKSEIRRQWQLHTASAPKLGDRLLTVVGERPDLSWAEPRLEPVDKQAFLFCQTVLPREFSVIVHSDGKAEAFDADGTARGAVEGNAYHKKFGGHVVQVDPAARDTRTVFLHVLTASEGDPSTPPKIGYGLTKPGQLDLRIDDVTTSFEVPTWLEF